MSLLLPEGPFGAYLFDCDGTIADSMPLHHRAWNAALSPFGAHFPEDLFYAWAGRSNERIVELLSEMQSLSLDFARISSLKEKNYFKLLPEIQAIPIVVFHIREAHGKIPLAVVSGSPRDSVLKTLKNFGLENLFETVVGAEDSPRGKPAPDPYLIAAKRLDVDPIRCLVIEDADLGIQSAEAAGMKWVRVESPLRGR